MGIGSLFGVSATRTALPLCAVLASLMVAGAISAPGARAQGEGKRVLLYTGTTGFRHTDAINSGRPVVQSALQAIGYTVDWEDCNGNGGGANNCDNPDRNPRIFTTENLAQYDAILLLNASSGPPGPLWSEPQRAAIIGYMQDGGGIAGVHNATDMGTGAATWDWWDGSPDSAVGTTMAGHAATNINNVAQVQVADNNHLSTRELPDTYGFGDEHYNFRRNVRGDHHVLATLDERTYNPGGNGMGQDHPITWCKLYDGDNVQDGTSTPKSYNDGRVWTTGMGHFGASYTENGGDNHLIEHIVGGVRWVAGEGRKSDCSGTVWSSFTRTVLVPDAQGPIGIDVATDGKVYWSEIGSVGFEAEGYIKMHDPSGAVGNKTTVATIPTRADHGNSEDGVLGMSLEPGFDLADPQKRDIYVYYSPRNPAWPTSGSNQVVGYNQISRFTLNAAGTEVEPGSERVILRVPKAKISGSPSGFPGGPVDSGPGHVGGAGMDFDSDGNLYLGVGDDVSPNAPGHNRYPPMDYRAAERWDARKTSANTADLRGKLIRIRPLDDIPGGTEPGVGQTYAIPEGNMFAPGTASARPEIYAMGFRQPFTVHADPENPGTAVVGEFCHDNNVNQANRAPAGVCEWDLIQEPGFHGWPFCMGNNSAANTSWRWNYADNSSTNSQYDCSLTSFPSDLDWAPDGQSAAAPTFQGLETLPGPARPATIWKKYPGAAGGENPADFGDLSAGGMQPVTGPIYRYDEDTAGPGAFPPYYDGSWLINNRGSSNGFWKEVRLREDNNSMLRVHDWLPYNAAGSDTSSLNSFVIGTRFGPDGALYMARFPVGCCRSSGQINDPVQIVKIAFKVQDRCETDEQAPNASHQVTGQAYPGEPDTYVNSAELLLSAADVGCAGVDSIEYRVNGEPDWHEYSGPITFDQEDDYSVEYRATDRFENVSAIRTATFSVLEIDDTEAPSVTAALDGALDQRDYYVRSATLAIEADDGPTGSGVDTIEYRVNGGAWQEYDEPVAFDDPAAYDVDYRATDNVANTSEPESISFRVLSGDGCTASRSDEFDGTALGPQWLRHTRNGGTPTSGEMAPALSGGQLTMPTNDRELDGATANAMGPVNFIGQDLPVLGDGWEVETQFTVQHTGGWQGTGLILWQADNNFFRSTITHSLNNGTIYVEQSKDNPTSAEGVRVQTSGNPTILPSAGPVTIRMRYARAAGANTVTAQYRIIAPESAATPDWVDFPAIGGGLDLNPAGGPRRDSTGSRIGLYAGGNFPGSTGSFPYPGTPANMVVDYFRVTPDDFDCEEDSPTTTATLDPAAPGPGGTYSGPVKVTLSATDGTTPGAAGVDATEYRVDGGDWKSNGNAGGDPFTTEVNVSGSGSHTVEYRSIDRAANVEETKSVSFSIRMADCLRSDEFGGDALDTGRWNVRVDDPGEALVADGRLILPILNEIDGTSTGPLAFVAQQVPEGDWSVTTRVTPELERSWAQAGLMLWQSDGNFVKAVFGRTPEGARRMELTSDNPTNSRQIGPSVNVGAGFPQTAWIRMYREGDTIGAEFAPDEGGQPGDWQPFASTRPVNTNPAREGEGVLVGPYAGSDIEGPPFEQTAAYDFVRFDPDDCPEPDGDPPTTTHALDPAAPGAGGTYDGPVGVTLTATDEPVGSASAAGDGGDPFGLFGAPMLAASEAADHDVYASGDVWNPDAVDAALGDVVTWHFDPPQAVFAHDVWLVPPGGDPAPGGDIFEVTDGPVSEGGPPVSHTLDEEGTWTFVCRLHSSFSGGQWSGMVGTIEVTDDGGGGGPIEVSGVDYTEYRVDGGDWVASPNDAEDDPFVTAFTVSGNGNHTVEYRSVDKAGNEEAVRSVAFTIAPPQQSPPGGRGGGTPPAGPPADDGDPAPEQLPTFLVGKPAKTSVAKLMRRGLKVQVTCTAAMAGKASLKIGRKAARKLKLKSRTLARKAIRCAGAGSETVTLKPSKKVKRKLRKARGSLRARLDVRMKAPGRPANKATRRLTLGRR